MMLRASDAPFEKYFRDANNRTRLWRLVLDEVDQLFLHWEFRLHCLQFATTVSADAGDDSNDDSDSTRNRAMDDQRRVGGDRRLD